MHIDGFGLQDCSEESRERLWAILRTKTPEERLRMVCDRMEFTRQLRKATEHWRNPEPPRGATSDHS
jgi:hypothetical protein